MIPLSLLALAVITLFYSVAHWNAWFSAMGNGSPFTITLAQANLVS